MRFLDKDAHRSDRPGDISHDAHVTSVFQIERHRCPLDRVRIDRASMIDDSRIGTRARAHHGDRVPCLWISVGDGAHNVARDGEVDHRIHRAAVYVDTVVAILYPVAEHVNATGPHFDGDTNAAARTSGGLEAVHIGILYPDV